MKIEIKETLDAGSDVLLVRGKVDGVKVEASGWMSAMTNHFDEPRTDDSKPREMTSDEKRAYCEKLLADAAPRPTVPQPVTLF